MPKRPLLLAVLLLACGDDTVAVDAALGDGRPPPDAAVVNAAPGTPDATPSPDASPACPRLPAAADRVRKIVVSHPYVGSGVYGPHYAVLELGTDGTISDTAVTFDMGIARIQPEIVFTPDGEVGIAVQDDGSLGVFRFESDGQVTVVHAAFTGSFYAGRVIMDPGGARAWVLDSEVASVGGGIYSVTIGCDGTLTEEGMLTGAELPYDMALLGDGRALLAGKSVLDSTAGLDAHLVDLDAPGDWIAGGDAYGDDDFIVADLEVAPDGKYAFLADNCAYCSVTRVAVVEIQAAALRAAQVFPIDDPVDVVPSPFGNSLLVVSGYPDSYSRVPYDSSLATPCGTPVTLATSPALPGNAVAITRGTLTGRVIIGENVGVRELAFQSDGTITNVEFHSTGTGYGAMVGVLGVQP